MRRAPSARALEPADGGLGGIGEAEPAQRASTGRAPRRIESNFRRRRSLSRILFSRPGSGSSSHSSGPPVARGIERPTRGNGRAARARPCDRTSLLLGLAPGGVYRASALTSGPGELLPHRFTVAPRPEARGGLLSVALSPDRSGPPLAATLPCGVRTFLLPANRASDRPARSGSRSSCGSSPAAATRLRPRSQRFPVASRECGGSSGRRSHADYAGSR